MLKRVFDIVAWLGLALVLAAVPVKFLTTAWQPYWPWLFGGGLVCILLYTLGQWREIARLFAGRSIRLGTISAASVLVVLGILAAINYISSREHKRWDLTASSQFTLSPQSVKVLQNLDAPLKMTAFAKENDLAGYRDRLSEYEYVSKKVTTDYVDPDKKPALAKQKQIQAYGTVAVECKDRIERVVGSTEQDLTNGIIKVVTGKERKVYFTQGHGEKDTAGSERNGYSGIAGQLARDNYKVERLPIARQGSVPEDASVVVVAGPRTDLLPGEVDALRAYLAKGGKLMLLVDPQEKADDPPLTNLTALAHDWAIDLGSNVVVDVSGMGRLLGTDETVPVVTTYPSHPIVQDMDLLTAFPVARSVSPVTGGVSGRVSQAFIETSGSSWAETDMKAVFGGGKVAFDDGKGDKRGPIAIAAAVSAPVAPPAAGDKPGAEKIAEEAQRAESRVVVFGDSDFASNLAIGTSGNRDLFMNAVSWLAQQENLIAIRPKEPDDRRVSMTANQQLRVLILALFVVPIVVFGSGVYAWWRRR